MMLVSYFSIDILLNMEAYQSKMDIAFAARKLPIYLMLAFLFLGVLMLIEIIQENLRSYRLSRQLKKTEQELLQVKAKLYDRGTGQKDSLNLPKRDSLSDEESISPNRQR